MDPFLESEDAWHDSHVRYVPASAAGLIARLPVWYIVNADQDAFVVHGAGPPPAAGSRALSTAAAVTDTSIAAAFPAGAVGVERRPFLQIIDRHRRVVVTATEMVRPSNKSPSGDRAGYLAKRQRLQSGGTNLVELDLLRAGPRLPLDGLPPCDYRALVGRAIDWPAVRVWPLGLRDRLPTVPVPLTTGDADVPLDLRAAMDRAYDRADYARYIYDAEADPPLPAADAAWAAERLAQIGR